jgi:TusA-related sulfurtransferase
VTDAFRHLSAGQRLRIWTDKWSVVRDLQAYAHTTGHAYLQWAEDPEAPGTWRVLLAKRSAPP